MNPDDRLLELEYVLPPVPKPNGLYRPVQIVGNIAYVSGHAPLTTDGQRIAGKVGVELTMEEAKAAARQSALAILATMRNQLQSLNRINRVIKLVGFVNCTNDFQQHPAVINGCSEVFRDVFGDAGIGARTAAGANSLPGNIAVEIEAVFELK